MGGAHGHLRELVHEVHECSGELGGRQRLAQRPVNPASIPDDVRLIDDRASLVIANSSQRISRKCVRMTSGLPPEIHRTSLVTCSAPTLDSLTLALPNARNRVRVLL